MERVLVVNVNWLGDCIMTLPAFSALKKEYPHVYTAVMAPGRVAEIFEKDPSIDEVLVFDERTTHRSLPAKLRFIRALKEKRFDTAICIHRSCTRILICRLAGIPRRIGYHRRKTSWLINHKVKPPAGTGHRQDYYLCLFEAAAIPVKTRIPQVFIDDDVRHRMYYRLQRPEHTHAHLIGVQVSANWDQKRWPAQSYAELCDRLISRYSCAIFFVGTQKDAPAVSAVTEKMKRKDFYDFCGQTTLSELAAVMENFDLFISNDSGPAHLAAAVGIHTLVLFGPTDPEVTSPRGKYVHIVKSDVPCVIPCYKTDCKDNFCMSGISVDEVIETVQYIFDNE
ncbi:MAG: lipopolysaccharide heptosyltransferase II [Candidatus Omnitrophica bacterium]|nr:lipopolysaccharide heptosyltransferase II [Candidatus Omnitrophota bacterium]